MHQGALLAPTKARRVAAGVVADIAKLSVGREAYYTRDLGTDAASKQPRAALGARAASSASSRSSSAVRW